MVVYVGLFGARRLFERGWLRVQGFGGELLFTYFDICGVSVCVEFCEISDCFLDLLRDAPQAFQTIASKLLVFEQIRVINARILQHTFSQFHFDFKALHILVYGFRFYLEVLLVVQNLSEIEWDVLLQETKYVGFIFGVFKYNFYARLRSIQQIAAQTKAAL